MTLTLRNTVLYIFYVLLSMYYYYLKETWVTFEQITSYNKLMPKQLGDVIKSTKLSINQIKDKKRMLCEDKSATL